MAVKSWRAVIPALPARRTAMWMPPLLMVCAPRKRVMEVDGASSLPSRLRRRVRSLIIEKPPMRNQLSSFPLGAIALALAVAAGALGAQSDQRADVLSGRV